MTAQRTLVGIASACGVGVGVLVVLLLRADAGDLLVLGAVVLGALVSVFAARKSKSGQTLRRQSQGADAGTDAGPPTSGPDAHE